MTTKRTTKKAPTKAGVGNLVKGARAEALPKMTDEQKERFSTGGWVNESIPEDKVRAVAGIPDLEAFMVFLAWDIGLYRSRGESAWPSVAEELAWAQTTMEVIQELEVRLKAVPPRSRAEILTASMKRKSPRGVAPTLEAQLQDMWMTLASCTQALDMQGGKVGRKESWARDALLTSVADWIEKAGVQADEAAQISRKVLVAVDIPAPDRPKETIRKHRERLQQIGD